MNEKTAEDKKKETNKQQGTTLDNQTEQSVSDVCAVKEIEIEEVAIDGICGVY